MPTKCTEVLVNPINVRESLSGINHWIGVKQMKFKHVLNLILVMVITLIIFGVAECTRNIANNHKMLGPEVDGQHYGFIQPGADIYLNALLPDEVLRAMLEEAIDWRHENYPVEALDQSWEFSVKRTYEWSSTPRREPSDSAVEDPVTATVSE